MLPLVPSSSATEGGGALSRRERKKSRTREDLVDAAVELFATQGYAATTIEQITERADVSPRTFFRYFASKEEVVFPVELPWEPLVEAMAAQPPSVADLEAVRRAYLHLLPAGEAAERRTLLMKRALRSTPALEGRDLALQRRFRDILALAIARRRGADQADDRAELVAALAQAVLHMAVDRWAALDGAADLAGLVGRYFELAAAAVAPTGTAPGEGSSGS